jgi:hypothetical protein
VLDDISDWSSTFYGKKALFIDNCSIDKTVDILKKIAKEDQRVKIIVNSKGQIENITYDRGGIDISEIGENFMDGAYYDEDVEYDD